MLKDVLSKVFVLLAACACLNCASSTHAEDARAKESSDDVFGLTRVWKIHLHVTAEDWKAMQPARGGMPGFGPPGFGPPGGGPGNPPATGNKPASDTAKKPDSPSTTPPAGPPAPPRGNAPMGPGPAFRPGSFGYEFDYVKADVELDGEAFKDVGLRFKGNGTYMLSAASRKRPFKIDFNRYAEDQKFHGLQQLNLHNNVMDPTHVRQALSYPVFQAAGVPSPRTAFADVTLTIDGECDHERLGLYTMVEEVDKAFLKRHFQTAKGLLLKPEGTQGLEYKGDDWTAYEWYEAKSKPKKSEARRLIDALRLIHQGSDDEFRKEIGSYLDTDEFARFLAANTLLANMDSFLTHVHNYYLYLSPETNKLVVLPWDMDLSMGAFFMAGSAEQLQELSINHPHMGDNKLLDRLMAWDEFNQTYRDHLQRLTETCFSDDGMTFKSLPIVQAAIKEMVDADAKQAAAAQAARGPGGFGGPGGMFGGAPSIDSFMVKRRKSVKSQLAGISKGHIPSMGFGPAGGGPRPGGPGGPPGGGFGPGTFHGDQILTAADSDKDQKLSRKEFVELGSTWLQKWDKDNNKSLDGEEIKAGLNEALAPPADSPFKPPAGFGPGMFLGPPLMTLADANKDGKTSLEEWATLFSNWFKDWDSTKDSSLDKTELVAGLNKAFAPPPGFGPPGFGGPPTSRPPDSGTNTPAQVGSSRVDLQACKLEYSIVSPK